MIDKKLQKSTTKRDNNFIANILNIDNIRKGRDQIISLIEFID